MGHNYDVTGFQSPCAEFSEKPLSLDDRYLTNIPSLFIIEAAGDSKGLSIYKGDKLLIDRSLQPKEGQLCLFVIKNEFQLSRYFRQKHFALDSDSEDFIWGVVTTLLREFNKPKEL